MRAQDGVALREADPVLLGGEGLAHDLEVVRVLRRVPDEDRLVGRDSLHAAVQQLLDAGRVQVELLGRHVREVGPDVLDRGRAGRGADRRLVVEVLLALDRAVLGHKQPLTGDEVRTGEVDLLLALVG
ncbi:hypothetical protein ABE10_06250, partial [Bacillus toyonensis]|nr:hypothetical protein [Bacillus toyonensis]